MIRSHDNLQLVFVDDLSSFAQFLLNIRWYNFSRKVPKCLKQVGFKYLTQYTRVVKHIHGLELLMCWRHNHCELYSIDAGTITILAEFVEVYSYKKAKQCVTEFIDYHFEEDVDDFQLIKLYTGRGLTEYIAYSL